MEVVNDKFMHTSPFFSSSHDWKSYAWYLLQGGTERSEFAGNDTSFCHDIYVGYCSEEYRDQVIMVSC